MSTNSDKNKQASPELINAGATEQAVRTPSAIVAGLLNREPKIKAESKGITYLYFKTSELELLKKLLGLNGQHTNVDVSESVYNLAHLWSMVPQEAGEQAALDFKAFTETQAYVPYVGTKKEK